ncbi:nuclear transport factor 2 family protein [Psychrobium sp. nBUS_13]|uniref:nuclear transport factor 2 family protein n=1 Tax=Psychrobium sp. nBUS_13 TaxID=3395319 RepID=UPI003EB86D2B
MMKSYVQLVIAALLCTIVFSATAKESKNVAAVKQVIALYTQGTFEGDTDKLNRAFHPNAVMNGSLRGKMVLATPKRFIESMGKLKLNTTGAKYDAKITHIEVDGKVATVTLKETGLSKSSFTNFFHLIDDGSGWKIISKAFQSH